MQTWLDLVVRAPDDASRLGEPVTCGVPWPRGLLTDIARLGMHDSQGCPIPLQTRTLDQWPDGSARWVLLDWQANLTKSACYRLSWAHCDGTPPSTEHPLIVNEVNDICVIKTG